jgi:hypothetical protein
MMSMSHTSGFGTATKGDAPLASGRGGKAGGKPTLAPVKPAAAKAVANVNDTTSNFQHTGTVNLDNISLATYVCDFGNVVVGMTKKKSFRLTNVGKLPVTFNFDKKVLNQAGIAIDPDKGQKILPNCSCLFNVVFTTRKTAKFGKQKYVVPIDVKGGPSYIIEFITNLTIPELHMSNDNVDFNKVCV